MNRVALWGGVLGLILPCSLLFVDLPAPEHAAFWPVWYWLKGANLLQHQNALSTLLLAVLLNGLVYSLALWILAGLATGLGALVRGKRGKIPR